MPSQDEIQRWQRAVEQVVKGPAPRGETFDLCRRVAVSEAAPADRREALRMLLEGAMADSTTEVGVAQDVMCIIKAASRGELDLQGLLTGS